MRGLRPGLRYRTSNKPDPPHPDPLPADCGGGPGYYEMVRFVETGDDGEREELREWLGDWDPEDFVLEDAQSELDG